MSSKSEKIELIYNSDYYWEKMWRKIDKSNDHVMLVTYDMDNKMIANLTLRKLIEAAERGVKVIVVVEYVNFFMKRSLVKELKSKGGILIKPNPVSDNLWNLDIIKAFNRYHNKVVLVDDDVFIGSINSSDEYSGYRYGSFQYIDLNLYLKSSPCVNKILFFFKEILEENVRQIKNGPQRIKQMFETVKREDNISTQSSFEEFLEERPPHKTEIQDNLCKILESAQESITIIQAYYLNIKKIDNILLRAQQRGVKIKVITAAKRDQLVYKHIYNQKLFESILKNGGEVFEYLDKSFHMKAYCVDNKIISLGSFNNDITSLLVNNESNYVVKRNESNAQLFNDFNRMVEDVTNNCRKVNYVDPNNLPKLRLYKSYFFYLFLWLMENTVANRKLKYNQ